MTVFTEAISASIRAVMRMITENPTPRTTSIHPDTNHTVLVQTPLGHGRYSMQWVRGETLIEIPHGSHALIRTGGRDYVVDDFRPRKWHELGVRVRTGKTKVMLHPGADQRHIDGLGDVRYRRPVWRT